MKILISTLIDTYVEAWKDIYNQVHSTDKYGTKNMKEDLLHTVKICYDRYDHFSLEDKKWFGKSEEDYQKMTIQNIRAWI